MSSSDEKELNLVQHIKASVSSRKIQKYKEEIAEMQKDINEYERNMSFYKCLSHDIKYLHKNHTRKKLNVYAFSAEYQDIFNNCIGAEDEIKYLNQQLESKHLKCLELEKQLDEYSDYFKEKEEELAELHGIIESRDKHVTGLETQLDQTATKITHLQSDKSSLKSLIADLERKCENLEKQNSDLSSENCELSKKYNDLMEDHKDACALKESYKDKSITLESENEDLAIQIVIENILSKVLKEVTMEKPSGSPEMCRVSQDTLRISQKDLHHRISQPELLDMTKITSDAETQTIPVEYLSKFNDKTQTFSHDSSVAEPSNTDSDFELGGRGIKRMTIHTQLSY